MRAPDRYGSKGGVQGRQGRAGTVARLPGLSLRPATLRANVAEAVSLCGGDCNPMWQWPPESHFRHPRLHVRLLVHWRRRLPEGALWLVRRPRPPSAGALTIERPRPRYNWDVCCMQQLAAAAGAGRLADQPGLAGAAVRRMGARLLAPNDPCENVPVARAALLPPQHPWRRFHGRAACWRQVRGGRQKAAVLEFSRREPRAIPWEAPERAA